MSEIKHVLYESGVEQIFRLIVTSGAYAGTYDIVQPDGWDEVDSEIHIDEEHFYVDSFIIGESVKIKFLQYNDDVAYDLIKNVWKEKGGDGQIFFRWIVRKDGIDYEPLGENFEINLNKYKDGFEKSMMAIETELKLRESQSKLLNREDVTVNLFDEKDIDQNDITPVTTFEIGYKKGDKTLSNFWFWLPDQLPFTNQPRAFHMFAFRRSDDNEFGSNGNLTAGIRNFALGHGGEEMFLSDTVTRYDVQIEFSNLNWITFSTPPQSGVVPAKLVIRIVGGGRPDIEVETAVAAVVGGFNVGQILIQNKTVNIGKLETYERVYIAVVYTSPFYMRALTDNSSIEITTNIEAPILRTSGIRVGDAIDQLCKNYTSGELSLQSNVLSAGGYFYNSSVSTGLLLRGLPPVYTDGIKMNTSLKNLLYEGANPLMALGFDVQPEAVIVEDLEYFFKDVLIADLSGKEYLNEDYAYENDRDVSFNTLIFGSKKYSTNRKFDIYNFNTKLEATTPLITVKNKLEKQTNFIIDEYQIQELIEDQSRSTNDKDDDLVLIDMVEVNNYWDQAIFEDTQHYSEGGYLWLNCTQTPFDVTFMEVGQTLQILEGLNVGVWEILEIDKYKLKLSKTTGIQSGTVDTPIKYLVPSLIKNRTDEGFTNLANIRNADSATNIRHNPKYQLARWFPLFGSGLRKKAGNEVINVTDYKNNSEATMEVADASMGNELPGVVTVGNNEPLARLRNHRQTLFNGHKLQITLTDVMYDEFLEIFNNWRYGAGGDRSMSRGYLNIPTPDGNMEVYPFGSGAFYHSKRYNELTIRGKVRGFSAQSNPVLLSVVQNNAEEVSVTWDYGIDYINPEIKIQASNDGLNWTTLKVVNNIKADIFESPYFTQFITGQTVYFRNVIDTVDYYDKVTNVIEVVWAYNDFRLVEFGRANNVNCGSATLDFMIEGSGSFLITYDFISNPSGGSVYAFEPTTLTQLVNMDSPPDGSYYTESQTPPFLSIPPVLVLDNSFYIISVLLSTTGNDGVRNLNCTFGQNLVFVNASVLITVTDTVTNISKVINLNEVVTKRYMIENELIPII